MIPSQGPRNNLNPCVPLFIIDPNKKLRLQKDQRIPPPAPPPQPPPPHRPETF